MGFATSLVLAAAAVVVFFAAYFVAYEPYRALYPDLVDDNIAGRAQSTQALWRGLGTILAIAGGGVLLSVGKPLPFVVGAVITAAAIVVFLWRSPREEGDGESEEKASLRAVREEVGRLRDLLRERPAVRAFLAANALWELALGAVKTFIILYLTRGVGVSTAAAALAVGAGAIFIGVGSPVSGKLADRFGIARVMRVALLAYGAGLIVPLIFTAPIVIAAVAPVIAFGGGVVMTLPYALLMPLMDDDEHGLTTGLYSVSRGLGTAFGPLLAGVAIQVLASPLSATKGYQAMWGVAAVAILASVPLLRRVAERA
jgi:predicted MFS family arabinose efflux permease